MLTSDQHSRRDGNAVVVCCVFASCSVTDNKVGCSSFMGVLPLGQEAQPDPPAMHDCSDWYHLPSESHKCFSVCLSVCLSVCVSPFSWLSFLTQGDSWLVFVKYMGTLQAAASCKPSCARPGRGRPGCQPYSKPPQQCKPGVPEWQPAKAHWQSGTCRLCCVSSACVPVYSLHTAKVLMHAVGQAVLRKLPAKCMPEVLVAQSRLLQNYRA